MSTKGLSSSRPEGFGEDQEAVLNGGSPEVKGKGEARRQAWARCQSV